MTSTEIKHFFEKRITYKPGYRFAVQDSWGWHIEIFLFSAPVPDADGILAEPDSICTRARYAWTEFRDENFCRLVAEHLVTKLELHERDEWLRLDGIHVKDPHPEKSTRSDNFAAVAPPLAPYGADLTRSDSGA